MTPPTWYFLIRATPRADVAPTTVGTKSCPTFCRRLICRTSAGTREAGVGLGAVAGPAGGAVARPAGADDDRCPEALGSGPPQPPETTISPSALMMATALLP